MERKRQVAVAVMLLLSGQALTAFPGSNDVYYPYETYDEYYKAHSVNPPPAPAAPQPPDQPVQMNPLPEAQSPVKLSEPPLFLFPAELGFGVAVGIPYDMFYVNKTFYVQKLGNWYRSATYKGPWTTAGMTSIPPELKKQSLAKIRKIRNAEFEKYWDSKARYQGKTFRPGDEPPAIKSEKMK